MSHIGIESRLREADLFEPVEHVVEHAGHLSKLKLGAAHIDPILKPPLANPVGGRRDLGQRHEQSREGQPGNAQHQGHPNDKRQGLVAGLLPGSRSERLKRRARHEQGVVHPCRGRQTKPAVGSGPQGVEAFSPARVPGAFSRQIEGFHGRAVAPPYAGKPGERAGIDGRLQGRHGDPEDARRDSIGGCWQVSKEGTPGTQLLAEADIGGELLRRLQGGQSRPETHIDISFECLNRRPIVLQAQRDRPDHKYRSKPDREPPPQRRPAAPACHISHR